MSNSSSLNIALVGYGVMGQMIDTVARRRNHEVCFTVDVVVSVATYSSLHDIPRDLLKKIDIIIDFSLKDAVIDNIRFYALHGIPAIIGTTGWYGRTDEAEKIVKDRDACVLYGANFSVGSHVFSKISESAANFIDKLPYYDIGLLERHHNRKKDRPSGTAIMVASKLLENIGRKTRVVYDAPIDEAIDKRALSVTSQRVGYETGVHELLLDSEYDTIKITHNTRSRVGFALGSVMASEWLYANKDTLTGKLIPLSAWTDSLFEHVHL